jgi:hypothetical protein
LGIGNFSRRFARNGTKDSCVQWNFDNRTNSVIEFSIVFGYRYPAIFGFGYRDFPDIEVRISRFDCIRLWNFFCFILFLRLVIEIFSSYLNSRCVSIGMVGRHLDGSVFGCHFWILKSVSILKNSFLFLVKLLLDSGHKKSGFQMRLLFRSFNLKQTEALHLSCLWRQLQRGTVMANLWTVKINKNGHFSDTFSVRIC